MNSNFRQLEALFRSWSDSMNSRIEVMEAIEAEIQKHAENTQIWYAEAIQEVTNFQEKLGKD